MKKTIKSVLVVGFVTCSMMNADDISFFKKLRIFLEGTGTFGNPLNLFMYIADRINEKQNGELAIKMMENESLAPNEQIDKAIEYVVPYMDEKQKLNLCRLINQNRRENKDENLFSSQFKNAKVVDIEINKESRENDLIIVENANKFIFTERRCNIICRQ